MGLRETLKAIFKTGYHITEQDYADWLDGIWFFEDVKQGAELGYIPLTTGIVSGGFVSVNPDNLRIDITEGAFLYVNLYDFPNPQVEIISFPATSIAPDIASEARQWFGITRVASGVGEFRFAETFTPEEKRTVAIIGRFWSFDNAFIAGVGQYTVGVPYMMNAIQDLTDTLGSINKYGNIFSPFDSGLTLNKSAGTSFRFSANYITSPQSPNIVNDPALTNITEYEYHVEAASGSVTKTAIDPNFWDNAGTLEAVPVGKFTVQDIYWFPKSNVIEVIYGQKLYGTIAEAIAGANDQKTLTLDQINHLQGSILRSHIVVKAATTDLSNTSDARFITVSNVGQGTGLNESIYVHNQLTEIQGGTTDEYYHLTAAQHTNLVSGDPSFNTVTLSPASSAGVMLSGGASASYGWRDLEGVEYIDTTAPNAATQNIYRAPIREFSYNAADIMDIRYHIPHDYVMGTDLYVHIHWSHNGTDISGTFSASATSVYAKGHNQSEFSVPKSVLLSYPVTSIAATPQYRHVITEAIITTATSGGTANLHDRALIEPDGLLLMQMQVDTIPTITGGVAEVFIHRIDIHYQSTELGTKGKVPNFYA